MTVDWVAREAKAQGRWYGCVVLDVVKAMHSTTCYEKLRDGCQHSMVVYRAPQILLSIYFVQTNRQMDRRGGSVAWNGSARS